ncbi:MAG TPA: vitamin K epoxide reductase family protein, partial [Candidatus Paceibacterota bacterium]|nr:vitamin K epoxide reductase family protein [Candidatus Paceibacterota bacterium]
SRFSKTLGARNEVLGMGYYLLVWALYAAKLFVPAIATPLYDLFLVLVTAGAFFFSLYLTAVQAFILKSWCTWCIASALCNTILFTLIFFTVPLAPVVALLGQYRLAALIMHNIGFILGLGAATITDILFFRFLKDHHISEDEKGTLDTLSSVIWVGLTLLVFSGLALYLPESARLNESPKFLLKAVVVGVVLVNGFLLNFKVAPYLTQLSFDRAKAPTHLRRLAFALGGVSIVSWYTAFFLGSLRTIKVEFEHGLFIYFGLLVVSTIGSQVFERFSVRKEPSPLPEAVNR